MTTSRFEPAEVIRIVAAVILDHDGRTLVVRKQGTAAFMQAGGKLSADESPLAGLQREIGEELGCAVDQSTCRSLGSFTAPAVNEPGSTVQAELFEVTLDGAPQPCAEIEELAWLNPDEEPRLHLAPLTQTIALPLAREWKSRLQDGRA